MGLPFLLHYFQEIFMKIVISKKLCIKINHFLSRTQEIWWSPSLYLVKPDAPRLSWRVFLTEASSGKLRSCLESETSREGDKTFLFFLRLRYAGYNSDAELSILHERFHVSHTPSKFAQLSPANWRMNSGETFVVDLVRPRFLGLIAPSDKMWFSRSDRNPCVRSVTRRERNLCWRVLQFDITRGASSYGKELVSFGKFCTFLVRFKENKSEHEILVKLLSWFISFVRCKRFLNFQSDKILFF